MISKHGTVLTALALLNLTSSSPTPSSQPSTNTHYPDYVHPSNGICKDYTVKETITYPELQWAYPIFTSDYEVSAFKFNLSSKDMSSFRPFSGVQNVTHEYEIAGTFCRPKTKKNGKESTVLLATHGLGFDRRYWASSYKPNEYSFAQYALDAGYSIFYYDRLGVGKSSRVSGFKNQGAPQSQLLARLITAIRNNKYTDNIKVSKVALVGHSYGSLLSNSVLAQYPDLVDTAVLTGWAYANKTDPAVTVGKWIPTIFASHIAPLMPPSSRPQFAETFDTGYLGFGDIYAYLPPFLHFPNYELGAAQYSYSITQPLATTEILSAPSTDSPNYKGKVLIAVGQYDQGVCGGDCYSTLQYGTQNDTFPSAKISTYVLPGAGHGLNFESNAKTLYEYIFKYLEGI